MSNFLSRSRKILFNRAQNIEQGLFVATLIFIGIVYLQPSTAQAATGINQQINYQARLLNSQGAVVPDGTYNVQFKIYKDGDGLTAGDATGSPTGTLLWTEKWQNSNTQGVTVKNGYFSVSLGALCALSGGSCQGNTNTGVDFNQSVLWLSINIGGTSVVASPTYDGEMLPMRQMAAAPYALNSNMLGGLTATQFLQLAPNAVQADSSTNSSIFINKTAASGFTLELQNSGTDVVTISKTGVINTTAGLSISGTSVCDATGGTGCIAKSGSGFYIHNQTGTVSGGTVQAGNFALQGSSSTAPTALLAANSGGTGDILDLQNASGTNVVTVNKTGTTLIKPSTNSANAFQVQDNSSNTVLNVDTTNDFVGVGQATPNRLFDIAQNSAQVTAPMALLEQNGSGDSALEFKSAASGTSIYVGQDTSNAGAFSINSSTAATPSGASFVQSNGLTNDGGSTTISTSFLANTTAGNLIAATVSWDSHVTTAFTCSDSRGDTFTTATTRNDATAQQALGVCYAPNIGGGADTVTVTFGGGASPGFRRLIISEYHGLVTASPVDTTAINGGAATTGTDAVTSGASSTTQAGDLIYGAVNDVTSVTTITAGTGYTQRATLNSVDTAVQDRIQGAAGSIASTQTFGSTDRYIAAMVAFKVASTTITDTFSNALFTLSQTGAAKFQNSTNSTTAFQIQTALAVPILTADTTNGAVTIKSSGNSATALQVLNSTGQQNFSVDTSTGKVLIGNGSTGYNTFPNLLVLNTKLDAGDPSSGAVNGAMYYNTTTNSFRCYLGATSGWNNCVSGIIFANTSGVGSDTLTATADTNFSDNYTIPANDCRAGRVYNITASGIYSTTSSIGPTISIKFGGTVVAKSATPSGSNGTVGGASGLGWRLEAQVTCVSTTQVETEGWLQYVNSSTGFGAVEAALTNSALITVSNSSSALLQVSNAWSGTTGSMTLRQLIVTASGGGT